MSTNFWLEGGGGGAYLSKYAKKNPILLNVYANITTKNFIIAENFYILK